jgi:anti-sigma factor RsiW
MNCKFVQKNLIDIVERKLLPETQRQINTHLRSCSRCTSLVERFAKVWHFGEQPLHVEPSPDFWMQLQRRIRESEKKKFSILPHFVGWERWLRPAIAVATVLIGMLTGHYLGNFLARNGAKLSPQQRNLAAEQFFDDRLGSLDDFPVGSVGEFYASLGQNN